MIYRCRACRYEEARGCLPPATCLLYAIFVCALSVGCLAVTARGLRALAGERLAPADPGGPPWWGFALGPVAVVVGAVVINFGLKLAEWLAFARRHCPACGARRWSWGFTEGFGL